MTTTKKVGLGGINVKPERLRALRDDTVKSLMESMTSNGLLQPIVLRPRGTAGYWLVAGQHRFEAARRLKWQSITATIIEGMDANHIELAEIDENLIRAELSPIERALHIARRKELYEAEHPETRKGGDRKSKSQVATLKAPAFVASTAKTTGKHRATVARDVKRGRLDGIGAAIGTSLDKGEELDHLIKLPLARRDALIARAKGGEKVSAKTESKKVRREAREQELAGKILALPDKKYGVILADPEWEFEPWSRETGLDRAAANHYPTSCTKVIAARDVPSIAAKDCALFLCATAPMLLHAAVVMAAWGFDYVTNWELHKDRFITGYWN